MFGGLLRCHTIYTFLGLLTSDGILSCAKFTLRPNLAFSYIAWQRYCMALQRRGEPNFVAWYKEWNFGFAESATNIRLGGHHVEHRPTF